MEQLSDIVKKKSLFPLFHTFHHLRLNASVSVQSIYQ